MRLEGVNTIEIPSSNYPLYYLLSAAPSRVVIPAGMSASEYERSLIREDHQNLKEWIRQSGLPNDIVIDLHDNTSHPQVWEHEQFRMFRECLGYRMKDGSIAANVEGHINVCLRTAPGKIEHAKSTMQYFSSRVKQADYFLDYFEEDDSERYGPGLEIGIEYYPRVITKWPTDVKKLPVRKGLGFVIDLTDYLRNNYSKMRD